MERGCHFHSSLNALCLHIKKGKLLLRCFFYSDSPVTTNYKKGTSSIGCPIILTYLELWSGKWLCCGEPSKNIGGCQPISWTPRPTKSDPAPPLPLSGKLVLLLLLLLLLLLSTMKKMCRKRDWFLILEYKEKNVLDWHWLPAEKMYGFHNQILCKIKNKTLYSLQLLFNHRLNLNIAKI